MSTEQKQKHPTPFIERIGNVEKRTQSQKISEWKNRRTIFRCNSWLCSVHRSILVVAQTMSAQNMMHLHCGRTELRLNHLKVNCAISIQMWHDRSSLLEHCLMQFQYWTVSRDVQSRQWGCCSYRAIDSSLFHIVVIVGGCTLLFSLVCRSNSTK